VKIMKVLQFKPFVMPLVWRSFEDSVGDSAERKKRWITTETGSHVQLDEQGNIIAGMGGKFNGKNIKDIHGTKKFTKHETNKETGYRHDDMFERGEYRATDDVVKSNASQPKPIKEKLVNPHDSAKVDMSSREKEALQNYTGAMYRDMNPKLRSGKPVSKEDKEDLNHLDAVFSKAKTTAPMTVFRGVGSDFADTLTKGGAFSDGAFMSTTTDKKTASVFTGSGRDRTIMEINVPTGSSAISANDFSQFGSKGGKGENEIILNRGQKYKVVDIKEATRTMPRRVIVELDNSSVQPQPDNSTPEAPPQKTGIEAKKDVLSKFGFDVSGSGIGDRSSANINIDKRGGGSLDSQIDRNMKQQNKDNRRKLDDRKFLFDEKVKEAKQLLTDHKEEMMNSFNFEKTPRKDMSKMIDEMATSNPDKLKGIIEQWKTEQSSKKPSAENNPSNSLQKPDNRVLIPSTSQVEAGKSGDKTMSNPYEVMNEEHNDDVDFGDSPEKSGSTTLTPHTVVSPLKNGMSIRVEGTPESHGRKSSLNVSIVGKDGETLVSKHGMFVKSADLKDKQKGIYGFVGQQPVGEDTWREIDKAMKSVNSGMPKYEYSEAEINAAKNSEARERKAREYDRVMNEGDTSGGSYNPYRDERRPSAEQMRKDEAAAIAARDKANAEKFKDTDFFAN